MAVKVLIVDDSGFFRRRLQDLISQHPDLEVVGTASNGRDAIEAVQSLRPDVITMDYEMPIMDGISAVKKIMQVAPTPILMFSSLTYEGASVTLDSLEAGAVDYLPKQFDEIAKNSEGLKRKLCDALLQVSKARPTARSSRSVAPARTAAPRTSVAPASRDVNRPSGLRTSAQSTSRPEPTVAASTGATSTAATSTAAAPRGARSGAVRSARVNHPIKLVAIGTSTGGPVALQSVLTKLPANFPYPIVLIQHMPASFTPAFASRLNSLCNIEVKEAADGDALRPGLALLAPGGQQMMVSGRSVKVFKGDDRLNYKPCVDVTFGSAANAVGRDVLAVILTGMGADGTEGARLLKARGATVWSQDEASSVIYGMPMSVAKANLTDAVMSLEDIGKTLASL